jgi:hypothetical protein
MKRIIDGVTYDTSTATELCKYENTAVHCTDFYYYEETLYRTRSSKYFLLGEGAACSPYSEPYGSNGRTGANKIVPLTEEEARKWLEKFNAPDEICPELYADMAELEPSEGIVYLRVPSVLKSQLEQLAVQEGQSLNTFLIKVLEVKSQEQQTQTA